MDLDEEIKSREEGEIGSESREKGDLLPCSSPLSNSNILHYQLCLDDLTKAWSKVPSRHNVGESQENQLTGDRRLAYLQRSVNEVGTTRKKFREWSEWEWKPENVYAIPAAQHVT